MTRTNQDLQAALADCASEPIHHIGRIQPHGCLLAVDKTDLTIVHASANCVEHLGFDAHDVLGRGLNAAFGSEQRHSLVNAITHPSDEAPISDLGLIALGNGTSASVTAAAAGRLDRKSVV